MMDHSSFDDTEFDDTEFDEDTSWHSDSDPGLNWSGWKRSSPVSHNTGKIDNENLLEVLSLIELSSKCMAQNHPFEIVELHNPPIPDALRLRIAYYSFPNDEEDIRLYSCLASGSNDKFKHGEMLAKSGNVEDVIQIGFHLSGVVTQPGLHTPAKQPYCVSITFDRGHITSCQCSCQETAAWCEHANALCLYRIYHKKDVLLRAPVAESLGRLERDQLQKFAQYLISSLPQQILPTAQRLLDELLSSKSSTINVVDGAPDPTGGASLSEDAKWVLDEASLQENVKKILSRFCGTLTFVMVDTNSIYLTTSVPPVLLEWSNLLRSFQGHEPEGLWNLLSITRHLFARGDRNAAHLLHLITEECLLSYQMMFYWVLSYHNLSGGNHPGSRNRTETPHFNLPSTHERSRHACAHLMEEVVHLWELFTMTPYLDEDTKLQMKIKFDFWNQQVIEAARKGQGQGIAFYSRMIRDFIGFKVPLDASEIEWDCFYEVMGIFPRSQSSTYTNSVSLRTSQAHFQIQFDEIYPQLISMMPDPLDEFTLINKLTQSLNCHGYTIHASKLACVLGRNIVTTYPERVTAGELNFTEVTEKAKELCEMFINCPENERIAFELAILGLTVPRLPGTTNLDEMKLTYLETELYRRLKGMLVTEERLTFMRYQARKLMAKPMLRGDIVLPYIIAIFIFEVLCEENICQCLYSSSNVAYADSCQKYESDKQLGYNCALITLGLISNAVDHKQPMLCESIRQHRRDMALALLLHCRLNNEKIDEILTVLLDRERYSSFMGTLTTIKTVPKADKKKANNNTSTSPQRLNPKHGFTFADVHAAIGGGVLHKPTPSSNTERSRNNSSSNRNQSDSDSGNGDASGKRSSSSRGLNIPNQTIRKTSQQRRHSRQNCVKNKNDKCARNENRKQNKSIRSKKVTPPTKSKSSGEVTDTDSGQEMNSPYEGDFPWPSQEQDWDGEMRQVNVQSPSVPLHDETIDLLPHSGDQANTEINQTSTENLYSASSGITEGATLSQLIKKSWSKNKDLCPSVTTSEEGSLSSSNDSNKFKGMQTITGLGNDDYVSNHDLHEPDTRIPLILPEFPTGTADAVALHVNDDDDEDDFNIATEMFHDDEEDDGVLMSPTASKKSDEKEESSDFISSTSSDSLNIDDFSSDQHVALVANQVVVNGDVEGDNSISPTDVTVVSTSQRNFNVVSPSLSRTIESNNTSEPLEIPKGYKDVPAKTTAVITRGDGKENPHTTSSIAKDLDVIPLDEKPALDRTSDEKPALNRTLDEMAALDRNSSREEIQTGSSGADSGNDCSSSVLAKELTANNNANNSQQTIGLSDLQAALTLVQQQQEQQQQQQQLQQHPGEVNSLLECQISTGTEAKDVQLPTTGAVTAATLAAVTEGNASNKPKKSKKKASKKDKSKKKGSKPKTKAKVTMNMQSVEAEAFSLFELAKSLLSQSRSSNTGVFSVDLEEVCTNNNQNRRLQLAAFEIAVFALNIHNYSSPNWFSRTYSTYVSWIENQAVEIGTAALRILNEKWEGVLTPSESITIACRASRTGDQILRRTAAELALSCLPYSQSLTRNEIVQTITLCREQDNEMLERACSAVENASRHGGVQPGLLFSIAREWHYLYESENAASPNNDERVRGNWNSPSNNQAFVPVYMTAEQYVQERMHQQAQEILGRQLPRNQQQVEQLVWVYPQHVNNLHHVPLPQQAMHSRRIQNIESFALPVSNFPDEMNFAEIPRYLENSYRVGMRALKALTNRMPDSRPEVRFDPIPQCSEDIRWMLALAASLGPSYLKNFCKIVHKAVASPYLLHDLALEAARHFALFNPAHLASYLKSPSVIPIVTKALIAYTDMVHHKLVILQPKAYQDFVELLRRTRSAFCMAPGGMARFNEILDLVRKTYPKKCELWQRIMNGLSTA